MSYSQKSYRFFRGSGYALLTGGIAVLIVLQKLQYIDRTLYMSLVGVLALTSAWLMLHAQRFRDEIQRRASEKSTYWGFQIGLLASVPVLIALMLPNTTWLDSLVAFVSRNHAMPRMYFWAGFMLPALFQSVGVISLRLLEKLRSREQA